MHLTKSGNAARYVSALIFSKFVKDDDLPFVMELPPYRVPTAKAIWRHTWEKGRQYLQKMATTILICSVVIWFLGYFPRSPKLVEAQDRYATLSEQVGENPVDASLQAQRDAAARDIDVYYEEQQADSYIGRLGQAVAPALDPLGFTWKMDVSLLTGVAAKELVVSTLGVMYSQGAKISEGEDLSEDTALQNALKEVISWPAALAFMVFILLYFPCIATFVAIKNETGSWGWAFACIAYTMVVAWICAFIAFRIGTLLL